MKYQFLACAALAAIAVPASAQDANANAGSNSNAGSTSQAQIGSNVQATGQSASVSQSDSASQSAAGALGNIVEVNQDFSTPAEQTINSNVNSVNDSNINSTSVATQRYEGSYSVRTTAAAVAPSISPSAVCMGSFSGGAGFVGFGVSGGKSYRDEKCDLRESARLLGQLGMTAGAVSLLCTEENIKAAMPYQCEQAWIAVSQPPVVIIPPQPPQPPVAPTPPEIEYHSNPVVQPLEDSCSNTDSLTLEEYNKCAERGG